MDAPQISLNGLKRNVTSTDPNRVGVFFCNNCRPENREMFQKHSDFTRTSDTRVTHAAVSGIFGI
jgi:hypothetical protein